MKRRVSVNGRHVEVTVEETEPGLWTAAAEQRGKIFSMRAKSANRAVSDWGIAVSRLDASPV